MQSSLSELTSTSSVKNVCLFISDSLREDHLPNWIADRGVTANGIAPATYTGSSIPSLLTGQYPATHRCWEFDDQLSQRPPLLQRTHSYKADTIWTDLDGENKPPIRQTHATSGDGLKDLQEPFVYIEHDKGGHSPYGHSFEQYSTPEFFDNVAPDRIPELYQESIDTSAERFRRLLDEIENRGVLDDTLVVFTSDHGELLGEPRYGGLYGHGRPMVPETVRIPIVFIGGGLPQDVKFDALLSGTDIAPTLLSALGENLPPVDGRNVWDNYPNKRTLTSHFWLQKSAKNRVFDVYKASGTWGASGGIVHHHGTMGARLGYAAWAHLNSEPESWIIRKRLTLGRIRNLLSVYAPNRVNYGDLSAVDDTEADSVVFKRGEPSSEFYSDEQLRALGYIE